MVRLQELQRNFDTYLNGKEKTPSGLKKAIEEIAERVLKNDKPVFSWNKCEKDQEIEFSGYFNLGEIERIEIAADYSGETVNVYINIDDEQLVREKIYDFFLKEIIESKITGQYIEEHTMEGNATEEGVRETLKKLGTELYPVDFCVNDFLHIVENESIEKIIERERYDFYKIENGILYETYIAFDKLSFPDDLPFSVDEDEDIELPFEIEEE